MPDKAELKRPRAISQRDKVKNHREEQAEAQAELGADGRNLRGTKPGVGVKKRKK